MKLAHVLLETPIDFKEERFVSWVFEDPQIYWSFVKELIGQTQGELGNFVLSNEMKTLKLETDAQVIVGPFDISFDTKKITTLVTKKINKVMAEEDYLQKLQEITSIIKDYFKDLIFDADLPLLVGDLQEENLVKCGELKVAEEKTFFENLCSYLNLILNLTRPKLLIFIDIKRYFKNNEFDEFAKFLNYEDVNVLFIDLFSKTFEKCDTRTYLMDFDRCEFEIVEGENLDHYFNN